MGFVKLTAFPMPLLGGTSLKMKTLGEAGGEGVVTAEALPMTGLAAVFDDVVVETEWGVVGEVVAPVSWACSPVNRSLFAGRTR